MKRLRAIRGSRCGDEEIQRFRHRLVMRVLLHDVPQMLGDSCCSFTGIARRRGAHAARHEGAARALPAKHRSLAGHSRLARRVAALVP